MTSGADSILARDVHIATNKKKVMFVLRSSKTHAKSAPSQKIKISSSMSLGLKSSRTLQLQCPYELIQQFTQVRGSYRTNLEPYFVFLDRCPVKPQQMGRFLKLMIKHAGFDETLYGTNFLCAGRTCDLYKLGLSVETIKKLGHWRSNAVFQYLHRGGAGTVGNAPSSG